jgi:Bacterial protein of unknown function (DUF899)
MDEHRSISKTTERTVEDDSNNMGVADAWRQRDHRSNAGGRRQGHLGGRTGCVDGSGEGLHPRRRRDRGGSSVTPDGEVDPAITLTGAHGRVTLLDVFEGRRQLVAYFHMWFDGQPAEAQCEGCTFFNGQVRELSYLHSRDVTYASSARARTRRAFATATSWAGTCRGTRRRRSSAPTAVPLPSGRALKPGAPTTLGPPAAETDAKRTTSSSSSSHPSRTGSGPKIVLRPPHSASCSYPHSSSSCSRQPRSTDFALSRPDPCSLARTCSR